MSEKMERLDFPRALANDYVLVDGVQMHREHGERFEVPPTCIKRHIRVGHFVELRIDSPRFSSHRETDAHCSCPSCGGELAKPILRHAHPESLAPTPAQAVPARGWGEDFWVEITQRRGEEFCGRVDNHLVESRLHGMRYGDRITFRETHVLSVHGSHRRELVTAMSAIELKQLASWLGTRKD